jgi:DNA mismatch repair ATPase MutS
MQSLSATGGIRGGTGCFGTFVPNDTDLAGDDADYDLRRKYGGKVHYMRAVALICIMAQERLVRRLCGIGVIAYSPRRCHDDLASGQIALREMWNTNILNNVASRSLVIWMRLAGTSTAMAVQLLEAVLEYLHGRSRSAKTLCLLHER